MFDHATTLPLSCWRSTSSAWWFSRPCRPGQPAHHHARLTFGQGDARWIKLLIDIEAIAFTIDRFRAARSSASAVLSAPTLGPGIFWSVLAGFTSSHAGGPPIMQYLMPQNMDKMRMVGTTAPGAVQEIVDDAAAYRSAGHLPLRRTQRYVCQRTEGAKTEGHDLALHPKELIMKRSSLFALTALTLAFAPAAWANTITSITPSASRVMLSNGQAMVRFMVAGQGNEATDCGLWITYGDNGSPDTRIVGRDEGLLPRAFDHTFSAPGQYTVTAKGQRVKQTFGCSGSATTVVTVIEERQSRREAAAETCPDGWMMREGSFNRRTGAFSCTPAYPAQKLDCGPGLRYFEADNQIGCRPTGRGRGRDRD